jgi:hypothetical protein
VAGQGLERREILRVLALAAGASGMPGFSRWSFGCGHGTEPPLQVRPTRYTPRFFSPVEYEAIEILSDAILPSDGTPGARDAGVSEFIDFMAWSDPGVQYRFRYGLSWLDAHARTSGARDFRALSDDARTTLLRQLAETTPVDTALDEGRQFFALVREYTVMGFYTSRIGLQHLGYPGLQIYTELPGCPHPDDPAHEHLPPPRPPA